MKRGCRIKTARMRQGLTRQDLAEKCGVSKYTVSYWETDKICPSLEAAVLIANALGCSLDYLACITEEENKKSSDRMTAAEKQDFIQRWEETRLLFRNAGLLDDDLSHTVSGLLEDD